MQQFATAAILAACLAMPATAAVKTYEVAFSIDNVDDPVSYINGTFTVAFDPDTIPYVNDAAPTQTMVQTAAIGFGPVWSRVDYFPFGKPDPGILIGYASGGFDNNTIARINVYDYRVRFIVDESFNLLSARGAVKLFNGPTIAFDTSQGIGTVELWSVFIDGQPPVPKGAIPEPATWGLMIAGFGLIGAAARRRSHTPTYERRIAQGDSTGLQNGPAHILPDLGA